jgi:hypothetical protein
MGVFGVLASLSAGMKETHRRNMAEEAARPHDSLGISYGILLCHDDDRREDCHEHREDRDEHREDRRP